MEKNYSVKVYEASRELTAKQRIYVKDTGDAVKINDEIEQDNVLVIDVAYYAVLSVHNELATSEDKDYLQYVLVDKDGQKYVTGSASFWESFSEIWEEMEDETEPWQLKVYGADSKNYKGRKFISCTVI